MVEFLLALVATFLGRVLYDEWAAGVPRIANWIVLGAVSLLPKHKQEVIGSEWLALIDDLHGPLTKLHQALGFLRAAQKIADREREIVRRMNKKFAVGTLQVLSGVAIIWLIERAEKMKWLKRSSDVQGAMLAVLTYTVQGYVKHAEAFVVAADDYAAVGNVEEAARMRDEGAKIADKVVDRMIDVSLAKAMHEMAKKVD